jgi:flagellar hook assembly protein FlgD
VTVEVYNIDGKLKRRLKETFLYEGDDARDPQPRRIDGIIWDGTDENGKPVPYGIYFLRILASHLQGGSQQMIGSNHSVAVIR